ncbi:MAG: DUF433 domain-containing protein [Isosphaeraceae bacterium]
MPVASPLAAVDHLVSVPSFQSPSFPTSTPPHITAASAPEPGPGGSSVFAGSSHLFDCFANELRQQLAPVTLLEHVLTERVVLAAWRLEVISREETREARSYIEPLRPIGRETLRAESSLETALVLLQRARGLNHETTWQKPASCDSKALYDGNVELPLDREIEQPSDDLVHDASAFSAGSDEEAFDDLLDDRQCDDIEDNDLDLDADEPNGLDTVWQGRLVFDANVSLTSPVVKGTWVTAGQVVSRIVDGWTWSDVLRTHPELTEDDIRACLAYTVAQDNDEV